MIQGINLNLPTNVMWLPADGTEGDGIHGGPHRHFDNVHEAARFVMEVLSEQHRNSAWATTDDGRLGAAELAAIYQADKH